MRRFLFIPAALILLLVLFFCFWGPASRRPADLSFINRGDVSTLDPNRMSWLQEIRVGYALWEGLYTLENDPKDVTILHTVPGSADRIDISDDKTVYTFHLRRQARWSNGDDLTAGDFIFAWRRMLEQPGDYSYLLHYIRGAREYSEAFAPPAAGPAATQPTTRPVADFATVGIKQIDAKTLRVTLKHPVTFFADLCAFPPFFPLHEPSMREFAEKDSDTGRVTYKATFTRPPHLVTNGPFKLEEWEFHRRMRLVANDFYWDRAHVKSRIIDQVNSDDLQTAFLTYDTGGVDWLSEVPGDTAFGLREKGRKDLHIFPGFGTYFYSINCLAKRPDGSVNPFADARVRRAFTMAIDKRFITEHITRIGEPVATQYVPPGVFAGYQSPPGLPLDVEAARKLLADAGYPNGNGFPHVSLLFNNEGNHPQIAQYVAKQWARNLGVPVELEGVEIKTFRQRLHGKDYTIARASWIGDYNDVSTFTDKYRPESENNDSGWKSEAYDQLCIAADSETDPARRLALFTKAEAILLDEAPIIPMYSYVNAYLYRDNVQGIGLNPRNMVMLKEVYKTR